MANLAVAVGSGNNARGTGSMISAREATERGWIWPMGVVGVLAITLLWMVLPGEGGAGWVWLPIAFVYGLFVAARSDPRGGTG